MPDQDTPLTDARPRTAATPAATPELAVVGIDVGGTKTHLLVEDPGGVRRELVIPSDRWRSGSLFSSPENLARLAQAVRAMGTVTARTSVGAGIHGIDTPDQVVAAGSALAAALGTREVAVVNDAELLGYAAGPGPSIQMIVGTGSVVVGRDAAGERVSALGHGWLLNDFGSAPGVVREAMRMILLRADQGAPADVLAENLMAELGVRGLPELALAMSDAAGLTGWGRHAPLVFRAADAGSPVARAVIEEAAGHLVDGVLSVRRRGAVGETVVAAGGVIVNQVRLRDAVARALAAAAPDMGLVVLDGPPVEGAAALARLRAVSA